MVSKDCKDPRWLRPIYKNMLNTFRYNGWHIAQNELNAEPLTRCFARSFCS